MCLPPSLFCYFFVFYIHSIHVLACAEDRPFNHLWRKITTTMSKVFDSRRQVERVADDMNPVDSLSKSIIRENSLWLSGNWWVIKSSSTYNSMILTDMYNLSITRVSSSFDIFAVRYCSCVTGYLHISESDMIIVWINFWNVIDFLYQFTPYG